MNTSEEKRQEILRRVTASLEKKKKRQAEMEQFLREVYKARTGKEPKYVESL